MKDFASRLSQIDEEIKCDKEAEDDERVRVDAEAERKRRIDSLAEGAWKKSFGNALQLIEAVSVLNLFNEYAFDGRGRVVMRQFESVVINAGGEYEQAGMTRYLYPDIEFRQAVILDYPGGWGFVSTCRRIPEFDRPWDIKCVMTQDLSNKRFIDGALDINVVYTLDDSVRGNLVSVSTSAFAYGDRELPYPIGEADVKTEGLENAKNVIKNVLVASLKYMRRQSDRS